MRRLLRSVDLNEIPNRYPAGKFVRRAFVALLRFHFFYRLRFRVRKREAYLRMKWLQPGEIAVESDCPKKASHRAIACFRLRGVLSIDRCFGSPITLRRKQLPVTLKQRHAGLFNRRRTVYGCLEADK